MYYRSFETTIHPQRTSLERVKKDLDNVKKESRKQNMGLEHHLRRDCLEISGISPSDNFHALARQCCNVHVVL